MKKAITLAAVLAASATTWAQEPPAKPAGPMAGKGAQQMQHQPQAMQQRRQEMQELNLSPEQKEKMKALREQHRAEMQAMREKHRAEMKAIMTAEQWKKFEAMHAQPPAQGMMHPQGPGKQPPAGKKKQE